MAREKGREGEREKAGGALRYVGGGVPAGGGALELEEGWSAEDHVENDPTVFARKLASGKFEEVRDGDSAA